MENVDAPKCGVPHRRSNLGTSPQASLVGVSKSSPDTKKKWDFQYLNDEGRPLTILALLPRNKFIIPIFFGLLQTIKVDELTNFDHILVCGQSYFHTVDHNPPRIGHKLPRSNTEET